MAAHSVYNRDADPLRTELKARAVRREVWALPDADQVPPWEWRAAGRAERLQRR